MNAEPCKHPAEFEPVHEMPAYPKRISQAQFREEHLEELEKAGRVVYAMTCGCQVPLNTVLVWPGGERMGVAREITRAANDRYRELMGWNPWPYPSEARFYEVVID